MNKIFLFILIIYSGFSFAKGGTKDIFDIRQLSSVVKNNNFMESNISINKKQIKISDKNLDKLIVVGIYDDLEGFKKVVLSLKGISNSQQIIVGVGDVVIDEILVEEINNKVLLSNEQIIDIE